MFVSYARNFEDVILWRALNHIKCGFYIDAGAASPTRHSATKAFYDAGWRGINIQPDPKLFRSLRKDRPYDTNLDAAPSAALPTIWQTHVGGRDVHFLRIGIDTATQEVLVGNDWRGNRPWIVIVEATAPTSSHETWGLMLVKAGYRLAYQDGLNRFYLAVERGELGAALMLPPNATDDFVPVEVIEAQARARRAEQQTRAVIAQLDEAAARVAAAEARIHELKSSPSWKITRPLRWVLKRLRKMRKGRGRSATDRPGDAASADAPNARLSRRIQNTVRHLSRKAGR